MIGKNIVRDGMEIAFFPRLAPSDLNVHVNVSGEEQHLNCTFARNQLYIIPKRFISFFLYISTIFSNVGT